MSDAGFDLHNAMMRQSGMIGGGGAGQGLKLFGILPNLDHGINLLSVEQNSILSFLNRAFPIINMNPSNQNGLLARILRALGFDQIQKNLNLAGAQRNQHEYQGEPIRPMATPGMGGGLEIS